MGETQLTRTADDLPARSDLQQEKIQVVMLNGEILRVCGIGIRFVSLRMFKVRMDRAQST